MQIPLQLTIRNMPGSPELARRIRQRVSTLDRFQSLVTGCRVVVASAQEAGRFDASVELRLAGGTALFAEQRGTDAYGAFREALASLTQGLEQPVRGKKETA